MLLPVVQQAADQVGGIQKLADALGIKRQAFYMWKEVPPRRVIPIEEATAGKTHRSELRPDLYPPETGRAA